MLDPISFIGVEETPDRWLGRTQHNQEWSSNYSCTYRRIRSFFFFSFFLSFLVLCRWLE